MSNLEIFQEGYTLTTTQAPQKVYITPQVFLQAKEKDLHYYVTSFVLLLQFIPLSSCFSRFTFYSECVACYKLNEIALLEFDLVDKIVAVKYVNH